MKLNGLEKAIKVLESKYQQDESKDVEEALDYLKSLKPELPQFVIDWINSRGPSGAYEKLHSENLTEEGKKVHQWFYDFWDNEDYFSNPSWVVMKAMANLCQFGAIVKEDDLYYIRAPKEWDEHETPYVCIPDCVPDAYALTMHRQYAEKFTKEEAVATMRKLRVNWHLEKVE